MAFVFVSSRDPVQTGQAITELLAYCCITVVSGVTFNIVLPSDQDLCCIRKDSEVKGPVQLILSKANKFYLKEQNEVTIARKNEDPNRSTLFAAVVFRSGQRVAR